MNNCYFCKKNIREVDFKNTEIISKYTSRANKIKERKKTGLCAKHQKQIATAIKRARFMGLLSYVPE